MPQAKRRMSRSARPRKRNSAPVSEQAIVKAQAQAQIVSIPEAIEKVLILGDLSSLTPQDRVDYYKRVCDSLGLNPLTMPFSYILFREFDGGTAKLSLYANKSCTEQLRKIHGVSVVPPLRRSRTADIVTVEADVRDKTGRTDSASGSVPLFKFKDGKRIDFDGKDLCNAEMKCETKAKRRATLSICGLAFLDESELDTMEVIGGVTKEGRIYQFRDEEAPATGSREAAQEVAKRKIAELTEKAKSTEEPSQEPPACKPQPPKAANTSPVNLPPAKYLLTIDWTGDAKLPVLTGDLEELGIHLAAAQSPIKMIWGKDEFWHVDAKDVPTIMQIAGQHAFRVIESQPKRVSAERGNAAGKAEVRSGDGGIGHAAPALVSGIIERVNTGMAGKNPVKHITMLLANKTKPTYSCFDKKWFEALDAGLGKQAELVTKQNGKYVNIVGARKIGSKEWLEDGTPAIQTKDREAGGKTLFG